MKKLLPVALCVPLLAVGLYVWPSKAAEEGKLQTYEYVTIRWGGREHTHLIRSTGKVEFLGPILGKIPRPDRTDDRALYMNAAMNAVAREGFEFAGMTHDEIVMKRAIAR